jgi:hypothetical protein
VTGDCSDSGGNATWTFSSGTGTLTQTAGNLAIAGVANRWYKLTYTVSGSGDSRVASVGTGFASATTALNLTNGTNTTYFRAAAIPADFVITATLASGTLVLDDIYLKQVTGGTLEVGGKINAGLIDYANNAAAVAAGLVVGDFYRLTGTDYVGIVHP